MDYIFVTTCYDKITCHEKNWKKNFFFFNKKVLTAFAMVYMFVNYIYMKLLRNSNFDIWFFFKIYSNVTNENMILKLIQ